MYDTYTCCLSVAQRRSGYSINRNSINENSVNSSNILVLKTVNAEIRSHCIYPTSTLLPHHNHGHSHDQNHTHSHSHSPAPTPPPLHPTPIGWYAPESNLPTTFHISPSIHAMSRLCHITRPACLIPLHRPLASSPCIVPS